MIDIPFSGRTLHLKKVRWSLLSGLFGRFLLLRGRLAFLRLLCSGLAFLRRRALWRLGLIAVIQIAAR
jgi:hypothetical protein